MSSHEEPQSSTPPTAPSAPEKSPYDTITIGRSADASANQRATSLIADLKRRCQAGLTPQCRILKVDGLWTWGRLNQCHLTTKTEFKHLDSLLDIFSQTIVCLDIQAVNFFTLPKETIAKIGGLQNLQTLRIRISFTKGSSFRGIPHDPSTIPTRLPTDTECLAALLKAARGVTSLDLTDFRPVCSPESLCVHLGRIQFNAIRKLKIDVKTEGNLTNAGIVSLSTRLPSLTTLEVGGLGYDGSALVPIFDIISQKLEQLVINDARVLRPLLEINFPKLRVLKLQDWDEYVNEFWQQPMFSQGALEVIELHCLPYHKRGNSCLRIRLDELPKLKRAIYHDAVRHPPPAHQLRMCQTKGVKCSLLPHHNDENAGKS
ncbi:hypothetical protein VP01_357g6 [Puccinia sorghi]|uniref:F-box domain-containing protein n=1 Tax=Puccinia sorghi TaxID=27349 RepID=A0A0L6UW28_9BASI|nr:hypothetical protein VP01_357g6 [Puccinia sorghi]